MADILINDMGKFGIACTLSIYAQSRKTALFWIKTHNERGTTEAQSSYSPSLASAERTLDTTNISIVAACGIIDRILNRYIGHTERLFHEAYGKMDEWAKEVHEIPDHDASFTGQDTSIERKFCEAIFSEE